MSASSIIVLDDVILSNRVFLAGVGGRRTRQNDRSVNQGGFGTVNIVRDVSLREYTVGTKAMLIPAWNEIIGVFEETDSGAYGFLIEDPTGSTITIDTGGLQGYMSGVEFGTPGFGNGTPLYGFRQMTRPASTTRRRASAVTYLKGPATLYRGGTPVAIGAGAGSATISAGPSYVTFVADASRSVTAVTVGATTQVNLGTAIAGFAIGGRLWLQDLTGADAALLNLKSHQITNIVGSVYTLATNTAGKTITAAGTGKKYPQPDEALTWAGGFYVPVQFSADEINWGLARPGHEEDRLIEGQAITLIEVRKA